MKKILSALLIAALIMSASALYTSAGGTITEEVSILNPRQNIHGDGYEWNNPDNILTLTNLRIDTEDDYGLKICDGATVILKGTNRIRAKKAALYIGGNVIIKGSGKLILESDGVGILCNSSMQSHKLSITDGSYEITAGKDGISSALQKVMIASASVTITAGGNATSVRDLQLNNGAAVSADAPLKAENSMVIEASDLRIDSNGKGPALVCDKSLKLSRMTVYTAVTMKSLTSKDKKPVSEYDGKPAILTESAWHDFSSSIIFGDNVSVAVDIILAVVLIGAAVCAIVLPKYFKKKKLEKILGSREKSK